MSAPLWFATALTRSWTATYTRGLDTGLRNERCDEIDCDLWEHQRLADFEREPVNGTAAAILLRFALGIPADVIWRLEAGSTARSRKGTQVNEALYMRGLVALGVGLALLVVIGGAGAIFNAWEDGDNSGWVVGGTLSVLSGIAIAAGLLISRRNPLLGIGLVAAGAITIMVLWYWLLMFTIPIGVAMVAIAYFRARQTGWPHPSGGDLPGATA